MIPGINAGKNPREALNVDGISKYKVVEEVGPKMVVRFTWTKTVLCVHDGAIVNG